ncbi:hypothetical protein, partial [Candidatus Oleimmundimicrobium sp.]|uniref:hypothetical protein n=1 Tax=Candidatus Oleimmundimicrobium sp. TaxID=3060597 RepID=UPI00272310E6
VMSQKIAYYIIMRGLAGCMPDSLDVARYETRAAMVKHINSEIDLNSWPLRARRQINTVDIWKYIQGGGKRANFVIRQSSYQLEFVQIDYREYMERIRESEYS